MKGINAVLSNIDRTISIDDFFAREEKHEGIPVVDFTSRKDIEKDMIDYLVYKINQKYGFTGSDDAMNKWREYKEYLERCLTAE